MLLLEPLRFGFISQPTKCCPRLQLIGDATAGIRVAELCCIAAFQLGAPCSFYFRFGHSVYAPREPPLDAGAAHDHLARLW